MADKTVSSQAQHTNPAEYFKKAWDEQLGRFTQMFDDASKAQTQWQQNATSQIDEMASLMKSSLKYQADLAAEMRKQAIDATKKTVELFAAR